MTKTSSKIAAAVVVAAAAAVVTLSAGPEAVEARPLRTYGLHTPSPMGGNDTYYGNIDWSLRDEAMISQLHQLINPHHAISYDEVWDGMESVDVGYDGCSSGQMVDIYAGICYTKAQQCGSFRKMGDCANREHTWPKSWWGGMGKGSHAGTDLHHIRPCDGWINSLRSNYPYGPVSNPSWTGPTGAKFGDCAAPGAPSTSCFEPPAEWQGDLARGYFYLSTSYSSLWSCCQEDAVETWHIDKWQEDVLRNWHEADPVSSNEVARNEAIFGIQQNRNPYIDHPELVAQISDF